MSLTDWKYTIDISEILLRASDLESYDAIPENIRLDILKELKKLPNKFHKQSILADLVELLQSEYLTVEEFNIVFDRFYDFADDNRI